MLESLTYLKSKHDKILGIMYINIVIRPVKQHKKRYANLRHPFKAYRRLYYSMVTTVPVGSAIPVTDTTMESVL